MKLLYAEDEPAMTEAVKDILEYHNYMVDAVSDGRSGSCGGPDGLEPLHAAAAGAGAAVRQVLP